MAMEKLTFGSGPLTLQSLEIFCSFLSRHKVIEVEWRGDNEPLISDVIGQLVAEAVKK